jgi:hypothetical protein
LYVVGWIVGWKESTNSVAVQTVISLETRSSVRIILRRRFGKPPDRYLNKIAVWSHNGLRNRCRGHVPATRCYMPSKWPSRRSGGPYIPSGRNPSRINAKRRDSFLQAIQELLRGSRINMPISDRSLTISAFQGLAGHGRNERRLTQASRYDPRSNRTVKWNVEPRPSLLSTQIRPPIKLTSRFEMVRPSPVSPNLRVDDESACENASKIKCCLSFGIPIPVSRTLK